MKLTLEQYRLNHQRMARVMHYLEAHLDADLRLETLAEVAHLSRFHFDRFYTAKVRESPIATVRRLRLKRTYRMLEEYPATPIHELAGYSGYGSVAAFSRAFTRSFGHAPSDIRDARSTSTTILSAGASRTAPTFSVLSLPEIPMAYQSFSGPAVEAKKAYDEFGWRIAFSGARWEYCPSIPTDGSIQSRIQTHGSACGIARRRVTCQRAWLALRMHNCRLANMRAFHRRVMTAQRSRWDYTAGSERLVDIYLPVRPRSSVVIVS